MGVVGFMAKWKVANMVRLMKSALLTMALIAWPAGSAVSQPMASPSPAFAPITLDQMKFLDLYMELRKIPMPADAHERIAALLANLERDAQQGKGRSDAKGLSLQEEK
jgi:hypothetical protein